MKLLAIFSLLVPLSALAADQEFYRGDSTAYTQEIASASPTPKFPDGAVRMRAGIYSFRGVGLLSEIALTITDTEVRLNLSIDKDTLIVEKRQKFLSGEMITLSSGRRIQCFRAEGGEARRLLIHLPDGRLLESIDLIPKRPDHALQRTEAGGADGSVVTSFLASLYR